MLVSKEQLQEVINEASKTGCDFVEVFVEDTIAKVTNVLGGKVEALSESRTRGVGIRLALGYNYVYGYTNDLSREAMLKLAKELRASFNSETKEVTPLKDLIKPDKHRYKVLPEEVCIEDKIKLLFDGYNAMKEYSNEISQAETTLVEKHQKVLIAKMDGRLVEDDRVLTRYVARAIASRNGELEEGYKSLGRSMGFEIFDDVCDPKKVGIEAARCAIVNLNAEECPSGEMPVILENGFGGVLFHEAVAHSLEATSVGKGLSVFSNKLGERVANECVSAYDDGTIENEWGSETFDDEGNPQQKRELIKDGILKSYMVDELNARRMKCESTGSSRRQSYKYAPVSRMSNTYIAPGKSSLEDMLKGIKFGLYAKSLGGGSVNTTTGDFNFSVNEGYLIEDGKITKPVKGAALVGAGVTTLARIEMVGDNLEHAPGMCGSVSGQIPVNVGQPRLKVSMMTVGGRK